MSIQDLKTFARKHLWHASPELYKKSINQDIRQQFAVGILKGNSPFDLRACEGTKNPVLTKNDISDVPASFIADPFMMHFENEWYMFFEIMNTIKRQGQIGFAKSHDGLTWHYQQIVLTEPFHVAYPYLFEWHGEIFMVPDTPTHGVRLYRADRFPKKWVLVSELRSDNYYNDSSIFQFADRWWMMTAWSKDKGAEKALRLFSAFAPTGPWIEHPDSPIVEDDLRISRPAGKPIIVDGKIYRFAQDCSSTYGESVRVMAVDELTPDTYSEREISESPILTAGPDDWNANGMHHIDAHQTDGGSWLACVDGWHSADRNG